MECSPLGDREDRQRAPHFFPSLLWSPRGTRSECFSQPFVFPRNVPRFVGGLLFFPAPNDGLLRIWTLSPLAPPPSICFPTCHFWFPPTPLKSLFFLIGWSRDLLAVTFPFFSQSQRRSVFEFFPVFPLFFLQRFLVFSTPSVIPDMFAGLRQWRLDLWPGCVSPPQFTWCNPLSVQGALSRAHQFRSCSPPRLGP